MRIRPLLPIILAAVSGFAPLAAQGDFKLMRDEAVGPLRIGMTRAQALACLHAKPRAGRIQKWEADGAFHQKCLFPSLGVSFMLVSEGRSSAQIVESITARAPCAWTTARGIRVGSTEQEVFTAYKADLNKEDSAPGTLLVAGSLYGGLSFLVENGKVTQVFLGAAAE